MNIKSFFFSLRTAPVILLGIVVGIGTSARVYASEPKISDIENNSSEHIGVIASAYAVSVAPSKTRRFLPRLAVPFVSWNEHHDDFITDSPYIPKEAILVKVGGEEWGIWRDERGILMARRYDSAAMSREDALPQCIIKLTASSALLFRILIGADGSPSLVLMKE